MLEIELSLASIGLACTFDWLLDRFPEISWADLYPRIGRWFNEFKTRESMRKHRYTLGNCEVKGAQSVNSPVGRTRPIPPIQPTEVSPGLPRTEAPARGHSKAGTFISIVAHWSP